MYWITLDRARPLVPGREDQTPSLQGVNVVASSPVEGTSSVGPPFGSQTGKHPRGRIRIRSCSRITNCELEDVRIGRFYCTGEVTDIEYTQRRCFGRIHSRDAGH